MIKNGTGGANTLSGAYFEQIAHGIAPGKPLHKHELGKYYKNQTGKYYSLSSMRPSSKNDIPRDKEERAKKCAGQYLFTKALLPDEAYLDVESSTLTIFEKKFQSDDGSVDEKIQTCGFKIQQYKKFAAELGIKNVYYIYLLNDYFKNPYYKDALDYIKSIPDCDYYFVSNGDV